MTDLNPYVPWLAVAIAALSLWYTVHKNRSGDIKTEMAEVKSAIEKRVDDVRTQVFTVAGKVDLVEDRITRCETELDHLPDKDVTHRLEMGLGKVETEIARLAERMKPIAAMADRMQELLLERPFK